MAWAVSMEDYSLICGWAPPLAASYMRLLSSGDIQQHINGRIDKKDFTQLSTSKAVSTVINVVISLQCEVGAWEDFFTIPHHQRIVLLHMCLSDVP